MKKVTIQDVAKALNLSRNTVAKAFGNSDTVSYETRYVVIEKAIEMGYSKLSPVILNEFKLNNKVDESKTIVVLARREMSIFWNSIILGISDELKKYGCKLQFNFIYETDEKNSILPLELGEEVSGILVLSVFPNCFIEQIVKHNIPVVFLDAPSKLNNTTIYGDVIVCEGTNSTKVITEELIARGLKKIGFIGDIHYCKSINDRFQGYLSALIAATIAIDETIIANYHTEQKFYNAKEVETALDKFPFMPEAIVCANDDIAFDVIHYLKNKGLSIPGDVAVTGYDNIEGLAQVEPFLTTVQVKNIRLGRRLAQQLIWRIQNPNFPREVVFVGVEVIFRQSSNK